MATNTISDMLRQMRKKTSKKSKEGGAKGSVAKIMESIQLGCVSQDFYPRKSFLHEPGNWDRNAPSSSPKPLGTKLKFVKEKVHQEVLIKSVRLMSAVLARQNSGKDHMERPCTKKDAPAGQHGTWQKYLKLKNSERTFKKQILVKLRQCWYPLQRDQRSENSLLIQELRCT